MSSSVTATLLACLVSWCTLGMQSAQAQVDDDPPADIQDFCVGGGWIVGTPTAQTANFGVGGGVTTNGTFWGHLNYVDRSAKLHVVATAVTGYVIVDDITRQIDYAVLINGVAGTATVVVSDLGEPGWDDTFSITLSTGYTAGGDLGGARHGGGNIQVNPPLDE